MELKLIYTFLRDLKLNNNRDWFHANKDKYLVVKQNVDELAEMLIRLVAEVESSASNMRVADVTYRIYRDTRFSLDKTPYKTHIGIFINPPRGKKSLRYGYYFHLEPDNSLIAAGNIPGPTALTNAIRKEIFSNVEEYLSIIDDKEFKKYFPVVGEDPLVNAPKGFPKDWEYIDLLKPRSFGAYAMEKDSFFTKDGLADTLRPIIRQMKRLNDFVNYTVDDFESAI